MSSSEANDALISDAEEEVSGVDAVSDNPLIASFEAEFFAIEDPEPTHVPGDDTHNADSSSAMEPGRGAAADSAGGGSSDAPVGSGAGGVGTDSGLLLATTGVKDEANPYGARPVCGRACVCTIM